MMKINMIKGLFVLSSGLLITSCVDNVTSFGSGSGKIFPMVGLDTEVISSRGESRADSPSADDLKLTLSSTDGSYTKSWERLADFNDEEAFPVGEYELTATLNDPLDEGFDCAAYSGTSAAFTIKENETTSVDLTATMAQAMISVTFSDGFKSYMADYSASVTTSGKVGKVEYAKDETRPAYVTPGKVILNVSVTKPNGKSGSFAVAELDVKARHHYTVNVDFNGGDYSSATMTVSFDDTLDAEDVVVNLSDDILDMPAPVVTTEGFTSGTSIEVAEGETPANDLAMSIIARGGIKSAVLTTNSTYLIGQGWPASVDLANASDSDKSLLESLGLTTHGLWKNPDVMAVVNFTNVISKIKKVSGDNESHFFLTVTDKYGKTTSEPVELSVSLEEVVLEMSNASALIVGDTEMTVDIAYNGANPQDNVKIQARNSRGTWDDLTVTNVASISRATSYYRFTFSVPSTDSDIVLRAVAGSKTSETITVAHVDPTFTLNVSTNNVYATSATIEVNSTTTVAAAAVAKSAELYLSTDGSNFSKATATVSSSNMSVSGLTAATKYYAKIALNGKESDAVNFTTESATQLDNSDMESWYRVAGQSTYWWIDYPGSDANTVWGTMNLYTTSEGGSNTSALSSSRDGMAYCANSGTTYTTDVHGGTYAAVVRTVGWGKGNSTGLGSISSSKYVTAGELFLGTPNATATQSYGTSFTSRPKGLKFYYKYAPKNSADYGSATIQVLDNSGNVLASKSMTIYSQADYTEATLDLSYALNAAKAATLSVVFRSSENAECLTASSSNLDGFGTRSTSNDKEYVGAKLYIDDIELIY